MLWLALTIRRWLVPVPGAAKGLHVSLHVLPVCVFFRNLVVSFAPEMHKAECKCLLNQPSWELISRNMVVPLKRTKEIERDSTFTQ